MQASEGKACFYAKSVNKIEGIRNNIVAFCLAYLDTSFSREISFINA